MCITYVKCQMDFCGCCLALCDVNPSTVHVTKCPQSRNAGSRFGTQEQFNACHRENRTAEITAYIVSDKVLPDDRAVLINELRFDLDVLGIKLMDQNEAVIISSGKLELNLAKPTQIKPNDALLSVTDSPAAAAVETALAIKLTDQNQVAAIPPPSKVELISKKPTQIKATDSPLTLSDTPSAAAVEAAQVDQDTATVVTFCVFKFVSVTGLYLTARNLLPVSKCVMTKSELLSDRPNKVFVIPRDRCYVYDTAPTNKNQLSFDSRLFSRNRKEIVDKCSSDQEVTVFVVGVVILTVSVILSATFDNESVEVVVLDKSILLHRNEKVVLGLYVDVTRFGSVRMLEMALAQECRLPPGTTIRFDQLKRLSDLFDIESWRLIIENTPTTRQTTLVEHECCFSTDRQKCMMPNSTFLKLSCGHFYHLNCISSHVRTCINDGEEQLSLTCVRCKEENSACLCESCLKLEDRVIASHTINPLEADLMHKKDLRFTCSHFTIAKQTFAILLKTKTVKCDKCHIIFSVSAPGRRSTYCPVCFEETVL